MSEVVTKCQFPRGQGGWNMNECLLKHFKPYLSTLYSVYMRLRIRLLKCFVLKTLGSETKQLRSLIGSFIQMFK